MARLGNRLENWRNLNWSTTQMLEVWWVAAMPSLSSIRLRRTSMTSPPKGEKNNDSPERGARAGPTPWAQTDPTTGSGRLTYGQN